jgi:hypothetical protein
LLIVTERPISRVRNGPTIRVEHAARWLAASLPSQRGALQLEALLND